MDHYPFDWFLSALTFSSLWNLAASMSAASMSSLTFRFLEGRAIVVTDDYVWEWQEYV